MPVPGLACDFDAPDPSVVPGLACDFDAPNPSVMPGLACDFDAPRAKTWGTRIRQLNSKDMGLSEACATEGKSSELLLPIVWTPYAAESRALAPMFDPAMLTQRSGESRALAPMFDPPLFDTSLSQAPPPGAEFS